MFDICDIKITNLDDFMIRSKLYLKFIIYLLFVIL